MLVKMGLTGPLVEPCCGPQAGMSGDPRSQNADSQLRLNFGALRKRKVLPSCDGGAFRPLKQRKYIAKDE